MQFFSKGEKRCSPKNPLCPCPRVPETDVSRKIQLPPPLVAKMGGDASPFAPLPPDAVSVRPDDGTLLAETNATHANAAPWVSNTSSNATILGEALPFSAEVRTKPATGTDSRWGLRVGETGVGQRDDRG